MSASSQGGRKGRLTDYETRGTAPQAQAQTQGQHGHEWSAKHRQGQGRACTIDGRGKPSRIHPLSHHTHHPARLNREAPPHPKPTLRPPEHAPWPRRSAIQRPKLRQSFDRQAIKSNQTQPVALGAGRQAGRQAHHAHAHMQALLLETSSRDWREHPSIHTRGDYMQFNLYTVHVE